MNDILIPMAAMIAVVWAATEGLGHAVPLKKELIAAILGPVAGVVAWRLGYVDLPEHLAAWEAVSCAAFLGLLATFAAEKIHDRGAKPIQRALKGKLAK